MGNNISRIYNNWRCADCSMHCERSTCAADVLDFDMIDSVTGEFIDHCITVYDGDGDAMPMCRRCAWAVAERCADDGEYHSDYVYVQYRGGGEYYTRDYAENYCVCCADCGEYVMPDSAAMIDGEYYCSSCAREHSAIKSYHAHKGEYEPIGYDQYDRYIGIELECDGFDDYDGMIGAAETIQRRHGDAVVMENDCSLYSGFEIISQPHSIDALTDLDIADICDTLENYGAAYAPATAGLHVHFSRTWLGLTTEERRATLANITRAYVANWDMLVALSGRDDYDSINEYAFKPSCYADDDDADVLYSLDSRYCAVNNDNSKTIEFRLGAGILSADYISRWIHLHVAMIDAARRGQLFTVNGDYTITITGAANTAAA